MAGSRQEAWRNVGKVDYGVSAVRFPIPSGGELPQIRSATSPSALGDMERKLKSIIEHRRSRAEHFPRDLFADPAWDIFLDLTLAELQQRRVTISSLCMAAQVPATTALRWIKHMTQDGWLVRLDDPLDARRTFISLSREASRKMHDCIADLGRDFSV